MPPRKKQRPSPASKWWQRCGTAHSLPNSMQYAVYSIQYWIYRQYTVTVLYIIVYSIIPIYVFSISLYCPYCRIENALEDQGSVADRRRSCWMLQNLFCVVTALILEYRLMACLPRLLSKHGPAQKHPRPRLQHRPVCLAMSRLGCCTLAPGRWWPVLARYPQFDLCKSLHSSDTANPVAAAAFQPQLRCAICWISRFLTVGRSLDTKTKKVGSILVFQLWSSLANYQNDLWLWKQKNATCLQNALPPQKKPRQCKRKTSNEWNVNVPTSWRRLKAFKHTTVFRILHWVGTPSAPSCKISRMLSSSRTSWSVLCKLAHSCRNWKNSWNFSLPLNFSKHPRFQTWFSCYLALHSVRRSFTLLFFGLPPIAWQAGRRCPLWRLGLLITRKLIYSSKTHRSFVAAGHDKIAATVVRTRFSQAIHRIERHGQSQQNAEGREENSNHARWAWKFKSYQNCKSSDWCWLVLVLTASWPA